MADSDVGLPRPTMIAAAVAILLIGAFAFLVVTWGNARAVGAEVTTQLTELNAVLEEKRAELDPLKRQLTTLQGQTDMFARGKMCVTNTLTDAPVTIEKLAVVYLDDNGDFQTFNSGVYGDDLWTIGPGRARQELSYPRGGWDGSVTYFAMWIEAQGDDGPQARVWPLDPEFCVQLPWQS